MATSLSLHPPCSVVNPFASSTWLAWLNALVVLARCGVMSLLCFTEARHHCDAPVTPFSSFRSQLDLQTPYIITRRTWVILRYCHFFSFFFPLQIQLPCVRPAGEPCRRLCPRKKCLCGHVYASHICKEAIAVVSRKGKGTTSVHSRPIEHAPRRCRITDQLQFLSN